jgi:hypothetical protein
MFKLSDAKRSALERIKKVALQIKFLVLIKIKRFATEENEGN